MANLGNNILAEREKNAAESNIMRERTLGSIDSAVSDEYNVNALALAPAYADALMHLKYENLRLQEELDRIYDSRGWRYFCRLYRIKDFLLPYDSLRYRIARKFFRGLRFTKRCAENLSVRNIRKFCESIKTGGLIYTFKKTYRFANDYPAEKPEPKALFNMSAMPFGKLYAELHCELNGKKTELIFPVCENPIVSIVIPVYNQWDYTYRCLWSVLMTSSECSYEVIVADDSSTDDTVNIRDYVRNINYIRNNKNLGFLKNCNNAAEHAKGRYILFLNNDTQVFRNWLASLVETMERDRSIGLAGSKILNPNGTLQEAGGIVWQNGEGANCGRGKDPSRAEYNYVKEVDYISGASIIVPRDLWIEIGGFDERYAPAYFEDSDLAFEIRKRRYKVVYQPRSVLIHYEKVSNDADGDNKSFRLMEQNRKKFIDKWRETLERENLPKASANTYIQRDRCKYKKTVLLIDDHIPQFDKHAGGKTVFNFLQLLLDLGFKVTFIGDNYYTGEEPYTGILQQMGVEVIYGRWYYKNHFSWMREHLPYFDVVFLNRPHIGKKYVKWFKRNSKAIVVYYGHDLHFLREYREYELTGDKFFLKKSKESKKTEIDIMKRADIVLTVSPNEKKIIDKELREDKAVVNPIFFYRNFDEKPLDIRAKSGLLFVGGFNHTPNVDAVKWFLKDIFPRIKEKIPDITLTLAGSSPTDEVRKMASSCVTVTGYLSDKALDRLYDRSRVSIVPLRFGAGVKGKTVDALYHRMAIVSTSIGIEGLKGIEEYLSPFDEANEFADEVVRLYCDDGEIERAYKKNINYVKDNLSYQQALEFFYGVFGKGEK